MRHPTIAVSLMATLVALSAGTRTFAQVREELKPLKVGDTAKDVELQPLEGEEFKLSQLAKKGPIVLVVLRGYPGYQCTLCTRQVADLRKHAEEFKKLGAKVVLVYPGPAQDLRERAEEFLEGTELPDPLLLVIDPAYGFTARYGLRWEAPRETAYPSTFVLDEQRTVKFRKVSQTHGDRADTEEVLDAVRKLRVSQAEGQEIPQDRGTPVP